jgi:hypothetical protein
MLLELMLLRRFELMPYSAQLQLLIQLNLMLQRLMRTSAFRANAVFVASVVANPVKSDVFAFLKLAVFVASVVANPVKSVFAFRANAVYVCF